ncbi:Mur ligase [Pluteus cervinus]|uniref:Mur ligase n=1 Tax=Pluteus cervinus TaxID=181527 RepID=A0ACD3ALY2_9AGAR|nr:Mur ligase [Pluteus cervinus]
MAIDLSLDRIRAVLAQLPQYTRPTIHITGTNGKGSVVALLSSILQASNITTGRFTSPHLVARYDSICINGSPISESLYDEVKAYVKTADDQIHAGLTNFELLTLIALQAFERNQVDVVVLEVGLGGRLDATNIVPDDAIWVSGLTAVDLDHQAFLGGSVEAIAREKAAIARPGRPFVLGPQLAHPDVAYVVHDVVKERGAHLLDHIRISKDIDGDPTSFALSQERFSPPLGDTFLASLPCFPDTILKGRLPLCGEHQLQNLSVALTVISALFTHPPPTTMTSRCDVYKSRISPSTITKGIESVRWPGRLSFHSVPTPDAPDSQELVVLADGAHNAASAATLSAYITHLLSHLHPPETTRPRRLNLIYILGLSHSPPKTPLETLSPLFPPTLPNNGHQLDVQISVAILPFIPPTDMPWIKIEPSVNIRTTINQLFTPDQVEKFGLQVRDFLQPNSTAAAQTETHITNTELPLNGALVEALKWASSASHRDQDEGGMCLVIVAGSLYLVADFYRYLIHIGRGPDVYPDPFLGQSTN